MQLRALSSSEVRFERMGSSQPVQLTARRPVSRPQVIDESVRWLHVFSADGQMKSRTRNIAIATVAGLVVGTLVLGIGGRLAMRAVAFTEPAPPRFTWLGTLQVLAAGAVWGALTGPLLLAFDRIRGRLHWFTGLVFGAMVLGLAVVAVGLVVGFTSQIVAPAMFIVLSVVLFLTLFLAHGLVVDLLVRRWRRLDGPIP